MPLAPPRPPQLRVPRADGISGMPVYSCGTVERSNGDMTTPQPPARRRRRTRKPNLPEGLAASAILTLSR